MNVIFKFLIICLLSTSFCYADDEGEKKHKGDREGDKKEKHHKGDRDGDKEEKHHKGDRDGDREGDEKGRKKVNASMKKAQRIYKAYDKDKNNKVSFEEWLKMKEGKMDNARKAREKRWFDQADTNKNGSITVVEFHKWMNRKATRE